MLSAWGEWRAPAGTGLDKREASEAASGEPAAASDSGEEPCCCMPYVLTERGSECVCAWCVAEEGTTAAGDIGACGGERDGVRLAVIDAAPKRDRGSCCAASIASEGEGERRE
jgi:hypothetical protein